MFLIYFVYNVSQLEYIIASLACISPRSVAVYLVTENSIFLNEGKKKIQKLTCLCLFVEALGNF